MAKAKVQKEVKPYAQAVVPFSIKIEGRVKSKKNGKQISFNRATGRTFLRSKDSYKTFESQAAILMHNQKNLWERINPGFMPINEPLKLTFEMTMSNRQNELDLSNAIEGPQDLLQSLGIIVNDRLIVEIVAKKTIDKGAQDFWTIRLDPIT